METLTYGEFSAALNGQTADRRVPAHAAIELTHRCPLSCLHCYNNLPMGDAGARHGELTAEEYYGLLEELRQAGCLWLLLTGGEILARPDFLEIYTFARRQGFLITLFTNGTLITPRIADHLAEYRPFSIEITLYGATRETYERLTGVPGSYDRCLRGIELLQERKLPLKLKAVAVSVNYNEIPAMRRMARERGLDFRFDAMMNPRTDCSASPLAVRLRPEEVVALDLEDPRRVPAWRQFFADQQPVVESRSGSEELYGCGGGVDSFAIDPYGKMSLCSLSHRDEYDLREGSFAEGWERFLKEVRARKRTRPSKCAKCRLKALCGACPAVAELETGDPEAAVDFFCHVAHLRASVLEIEVPVHGECEYCAGGSGQRALTASLAALHRIHEDRPPERGPLTVLPVLGQEPAVSTSGGCRACAPV